ncbi:MAG: hypothetical protein M3506_10030 [Chloroflexota bacterium]|nr:hypothetical protein [Chloroflexota bacterium]
MLARRVLAGFLAGASGLVGLLLILILILVGFGMLSLVRELAIGQQGDVGFWSALGTAFARSLGSLPGYFWSARWGMLALGLLGILLAFADIWRARVSRRWRDQLGLVLTAAVVSALVIGGIYAYREVLYRLVVDRPELSNQQEVVLTSTSAQLALGVLAALALTYVVWASWIYWFEHWSTLLRVSRPQAVPSVATQSTTEGADDWRAQQQRTARLRRGTQVAVDPVSTPASMPVRDDGIAPHILAGLVVTSVLLFFLARGYDDVGPGLLNAGLWVTTDQPESAASLSFPREPVRLVVSNIGGSGTVRLRLTEQGATVRQVDAMRLPDNSTMYATEELQLGDLSSGEYALEASLEDGGGGLLNYAALHGGGVPGRLLAAALGLVAGVWAAFATVGLLEMIVRLGYFGR